MAVCHDCVSRGSVSGSAVGGDCRIRLLKCRNSAGPLCLHLFLFWIIGLTLYGSFYFIRATVFPPVGNNATRIAPHPACRSMSDKAGCDPPATAFSISYVSINDTEKAESIARLLVQRKLAACVQILPQMTSIYSWKGKIEKDDELLMIIKSRSSKLAQMTNVIVANHPYEVCEVVSVPITQGNPAYLKWLDEQMPDSND